MVLSRPVRMARTPLRQKANMQGLQPNTFQVREVKIQMLDPGLGFWVFRVLGSMCSGQGLELLLGISAVVPREI